MADSKVPALTELAAAPASNDELYIVDKSDTTDDATGSSKKITVANLTSGLASSSHTHGIADIEAAALVTAVEGIASNDNDTTIPTSAAVKAYADAAASGAAAINDITDITITTPADNEVLAYDNGSSSWINQTPAEAGLQAAPAEGAFADGDKTKLDHITVTQAVDLDQLETDVNALANGMVYKGNWDASVGSFPGAGAAQTGWFYTVSTGGTVDSVAFVAGDRLIAIADNASATTYAANWSQLDATDAVTSVNSQTGNVVLDADDIDDTSTTNKFATAAQLSKIDGVEASADVTDATNVTSALASVSVDAHSDVNLAKSKTPADGDVLTFDGTDWNAETPAAGGGGQTVYDVIVDAAGGGDYTDISTAIAALGANKTMFVRNGTYTEAAGLGTVNAGCTIIGESAYGVDIQLTGTTSTLWSNAYLTVKNIGFSITDTNKLQLAGQYMAVEGCVFRLSGTSGSQKLSFTSQYGTFIGNRVIDTHTSQDSTVVFFNGASSTVSGNAFYFLYGGDSTTAGRLTLSSADCTFSGNAVQCINNSTSGAALISARGTVNGNIIRGNSGYTCGIYATQPYTAITGNFITDCVKGIVCDDADINISGNTIEANAAASGVGIEIASATSCVVNGNVIKSGSSGTAINANSADYCAIMGNTIKDANTAISLGVGSTYNTVIGNTMNTCTTNVSNSGTGNLVLTATDSDPLNTTGA